MKEDYTLEEVQDFCRENDQVFCLVVLKDLDVDHVRVSLLHCG